jgi:hypothetical protein
MDVSRYFTGSKKSGYVRVPHFINLNSPQAVMGGRGHFNLVIPDVDPYIFEIAVLMQPGPQPFGNDFPVIGGM